MRIQISKFMLFFLMGFTLIPGKIQAQEPGKNIQILIHLLDYVSRDYAGAVQDSQIIDKGEYEEQLEFSSNVMQYAKQDEQLKNTEGLIERIAELQENIIKKVAAEKIATLAQGLKNDIIDITGFKPFPTAWPNLEQGKTLFASNCVTCHGPSGHGDGVLAEGMNPPPINFHNDTLMSDLTTFQAYNSVRLGIPGSSMRAYTELTEKETWDLAFYVKSLQHQNTSISEETLKATFPTIAAAIPLEKAVNMKDPEIIAKSGLSGADAEEYLVALRMHSMDENPAHGSLDLAKTELENALSSYQDGNYKKARNHALTAYLEGIEPVEPSLRSKDAAFVRTLESAMMALRVGIEKRKSPEEVKALVDTNLDLVAQAKDKFTGDKLSFWLSLLLSASILLREGLEAFLIIAVIIALIKKSGVPKALPWLHGGWIVALLLGYAGWHFSGVLLQLSGQNRELLEGGVALLSVLVLTYVGFWLHSNSQASKWKVFVEEKVNTMLQKEKMYGLAFFSFMVVFREAFESILFLQAIRLETSVENQSAIGLGVLIAFVLVAVLVTLVVRFSTKIPIRQMFRYSSWMISLLAVILIGKGIHSIQESGFFPVTEFPLNLRLEWAGVYPTMESLMAQIALICLLVLLWYVQRRRLKVHA